MKGILFYVPTDVLIENTKGSFINIYPNNMAGIDVDSYF